MYASKESLLGPPSHASAGGAIQNHIVAEERNDRIRRMFLKYHI